MSSLLRTKGVQIGQDNTASNNFTLYQPGVPDGTLRIGNGNSGSTTDALTINSSGNVGIGTSSPSGKVEVNGGNFVLDHTTPQTIYKVSGTEKGYTRLNSDVLESNSLSGYGWKVNGFNKMLMNSDGIVTQTSLPFVRASVASGTAVQLISSGNTYIIKYGAIRENNGNHYDTTNYRFTCPVAGIYSVSAIGQLNGLPSASLNYRMYIAVNSAALIGAYSGTSAIRQYENCHISGMVKCSANDYIDIRMSGHDTGSLEYTSVDSRWSFSVVLIG